MRYKKLIAAFMVFTSLMATAAFAESFKSKLFALDSVISVDEIVQSGDNQPFSEKYIVTF